MSFDVDVRVNVFEVRGGWREVVSKDVRAWSMND